MSARGLGRLAGALAVAGCLGITTLAASAADFAQQQRGRYLATVGDCAACHTATGGAPLAGGKGIETPFGVIYAPNITPDPATGIGAWSSDQFYHAMHEGIAADGSHLYPAFPYPWFTRATREDVDAIYAYLRTVPPVHNEVPEPKLPWPLGDRLAMVGWNTLYFKKGTFQPDPDRSELWNRGAYLVEGLGHCGACHSPKNLFGAVEQNDLYAGSDLQNWFAPSLTGDERAGLGRWSVAEIVTYLKTGQTERTIATGPMREVVEMSTSQMTDEDLTAIATYLKSLPAPEPGEAPHRPAEGVLEAGEAIFMDNCMACHRGDGMGVPGLFPTLKGSEIVQSASPQTVIRVVLEGARGAATAATPTAPAMPAFDWKLSDRQVAAVTSYVRSAWGNRAAPVTAGEVRALRQALRAHAPMTAGQASIH